MAVQSLGVTVWGFLPDLTKVQLNLNVMTTTVCFQGDFDIDGRKVSCDSFRNEKRVQFILCICCLILH